MTTQTISQFDVMDENMLAAVEGGGNNHYPAGYKFGQWLRSFCEDYLICAKTVYAPTLEP